MIKNVLITTSSFAEKNHKPIELLKAKNLIIRNNPYKRKITKSELIELIGDVDILIAGTEQIDNDVLDKAKKLKLISRVGVGYENIDLDSAMRKNIKVSITPDSPSPAIAELTIGLMFSLLRHTHISNLLMRKKQWYRFLGRRITEVTIGIIGVGRIGSQVFNLLNKLGVKKILISDTKRKEEIHQSMCDYWSSNDEIYKKADIISLHVPLNKNTKDMIALNQLKLMKKNAMLINTSRGGIINEGDLLKSLESGHLEGVAIDVFDNEPYKGPLINIDRCLLTSHIGSLSSDCRINMEIEAVEEVIRFVNNQALHNEVMQDE